jgi:hypothetical protein
MTRERDAGLFEIPDFHGDNLAAFSVQLKELIAH